MTIKRPKIAVCTKHDQPDKTQIFEDTLKYRLDCTFCLKNDKSLATRYNEAIRTALEEDSDCLILVHDDVSLEEDPIPKLEVLFNRFDLVGVAGPKKIELKSPALWHLMGGGFQSGNLHGCVQHLQEEIIGYGPKYEISKPKTKFGPYPHRVVMIDGVFMALNRDCMEKMRFDETNPSKYHFYDLEFSLNCHLNGLSVGVGDFLITHASPGLREFTSEWLEGEKWFLDTFNNKL
jgi:hypothetical protein